MSWRWHFHRHLMGLRAQTLQGRLTAKTAHSRTVTSSVQTQSDRVPSWRNNSSEKKQLRGTQSRPTPPPIEPDHNNEPPRPQKPQAKQTELWYGVKQPIPSNTQALANKHCIYCLRPSRRHVTERSELPDWCKQWALTKGYYRASGGGYYWSPCQLSSILIYIKGPLEHMRRPVSLTVS